MKGNMMLIIIAAASLVGGGAGGYFARGMFSKAPAGGEVAVEGEHGTDEKGHDEKESDKSAKEDKASEESHGGGGEAKPDSESQLGPFIVNLADDGARRYLRATLQLGLRKESYKKYFSKIDPRMRDALLLILSSRRTSDLLSTEGKAKLREDIAQQLNTIVGKDVVEEVYFVDFLIQ